GADAGDLVLGLQSANPEVLVLGELMEDVGGGGDGVAPEEQRQLGQLSGRDETPGQGGIAGDVGVEAGLEGSRLDFVGGRKELRRLSEVPSGLEGQSVGFRD